MRPREQGVLVDPRNLAAARDAKLDYALACAKWVMQQTLPLVALDEPSIRQTFDRWVAAEAAAHPHVIAADNAANNEHDYYTGGAEWRLADRLQ